MTAACGVNCEICGLKDACGGCPPGTDPSARDRADEIVRLFGIRCPVLLCAIEKNVDYCLRCDSFPCDIHYRYNYPYSDFLLDALKVMKEHEYELGSDEMREEMLRLAKKYRKPKQ